MFGQNKSPHRCVSQTISKQRCGIYLFIFFASIASAQTQNNRELNDQTVRERTQQTTTYEFQPTRPEEGDFKDFLKNLHGSYSVSLMGPRLIGASNETYNIYQADIAPIQLYHTWQVGYQVSDTLQMGINGSVVQNIADNIKGRTGFIRNRSFENYDPNFYFNMPKLVQVPGWSVFTSASFSLSLTQASQDISKITSIQIQQSWFVNTFPSEWSYGFALYLNPQFYTDPIPSGFTDRQTLYASIGHRLSYRVSPNVILQTSSTFDIEHRSPDSKGMLHFGDGLEDRFRMGCAIMPNIFPMYMTIGGYFQFLIWEPRADTSIVGADFTIGF